MCAPDHDDHEVATAGTFVADHMSRQILAVRGDCDLGTAINTVLASGHRHVAVVDSGGRFEGVLPAEIITAAWMTRLGHHRRLIRDLVTGPRVHLSPDTSMQTAASVMLSYSVDAVAVLGSDDRLVGVLTWGDIVAMVVECERT